MIERFIDYMQFSANIQEIVCITNKWDTVFPIRFYSRGYRHPYGYRIYFGNQRSKQALVIASGDAMENMRSSGMLDAEILQHALSLNAKFSRIDLAVTNWNTFDGFVTVGDIAQWYADGKILSPLSKGGCKLISSLSEGGKDAKETLYIGDLSKRGKRGIFRGYDKGIELNLGEYMATRIELEEKRDNAHTTALRIADTNDIAGNFRARFDVKHRDFDWLMDADAVSTKRGAASSKNIEKQEELDKRWAWLMEQVAPSLRKAIEDDIALGKGYARVNAFLIAAGVTKRIIRKA